MREKFNYLQEWKPLGSISKWLNLENINLDVVILLYMNLIDIVNNRIL